MDKKASVPIETHAGDDEDFVYKSAASSDTEMAHKQYQVESKQVTPKKEAPIEIHELISE